MRLQILKPNRILIPTLVFVTFISFHYLLDNLSFLKLQFSEINVDKSQRCRVVNPNDSISLRLEHKCDMFSGKWVPYPKGPYYTNKSGCVIQDGQNCMKFGRPDTEFMKWRWKPDECELPLFDAERFLAIVRGKSMAFVGDSVARNQMQSLGCLLSSVANFIDESNTTDLKYKRWFYPDYNFTLTLSRTTHLVKSLGVDAFPENPIDLYLDEVDEAWPTQVVGFDYLIISIGHWFSKPLMYYENGKVVGCSTCKKKNITDLTMYYGYRLALETAFRTLMDLRGFKGIVFLRTISPTHFEAEERKGGGNCVRKRPFAKQEMKFDWYVGMFYMIQMEEFRVAEKKGREKGLKFRLLDVTEAMRMRPDGHPNHYWHPPGVKKKRFSDCLHWCLPGPIDTWNELLLHMLKKEEAEGEGENH